MAGSEVTSTVEEEPPFSSLRQPHLGLQLHTCMAELNIKQDHWHREKEREVCLSSPRRLGLSASQIGLGLIILLTQSPQHLTPQICSILPGVVEHSNVFDLHFLVERR